MQFQLLAFKAVKVQSRGPGKEMRRSGKAPGSQKKAAPKVQKEYEILNFFTFIQFELGDLFKQALAGNLKQFGHARFVPMIFLKRF